MVFYNIKDEFYVLDFLSEVCYNYLKEKIMAFLIGLFLGFFIGAYLMYFDAKNKVKEDLIPFIDDSGSMAWKKIRKDIP